MHDRQESMSGLLTALAGIQPAAIVEDPSMSASTNKPAEDLAVHTGIPEKFTKESRLYPVSSLDPPNSPVSPLDGRPFSVKHAFQNSTVMLTGATGYVGSVIMEQILRTCPTCRIITAIRSKLGADPKKRMEKLLTRQLFQLLAGQRAHVLSRITVLDAELSGENCGIHEDDLPRLASVDYIIHCAASIRFDLPIQAMMKQNYTTTSSLLDLADQHMPRLKCFTYVSTAFVNFPQPDGTCIKEELYPLEEGGDWQEDIEVAQQLIAMPEHQANSKAYDIMARRGFINTYMFSKNLTEKMVMLRNGKPAPIVIVRPSLIGGIAGQPCPGYIGNTSGFTGVILGVGAGIITMSNHDPKRVFPLVPADIVSSIIISATAAAGMDAGKKQLFAPRIVHACTSCTMPVTGERIQVLASNYMNEDPIERRVTWRTDYRFVHTSSRLRYQLHCLVRGLKLRAFTFMLRILGYPRIADKILEMWYQFSLVGSAEAQINVTFQSSAAGVLHGMMPQDERYFFKVLWHADLQDSWLRYIRTYCAGTKHYYLNQAPRVFDMQDFSPTLLVGRPSIQSLRSRSRSFKLT